MRTVVPSAALIATRTARMTFYLLLSHQLFFPSLC